MGKMHRFYHKTCASKKMWIDKFTKRNYFGIKHYLKGLNTLKCFLFALKHHNFLYSTVKIEAKKIWFTSFCSLL